MRGGRAANMPQMTGQLLQGQAGGASWQDDVIPTQLEQVAYGSLPFYTHPIDTVTGRQGWGPFAGAWQPVQFIDPAQNISVAWTGTVKDRFGPGYDNTTLFEDRSLSSADNTSMWAALRDLLGQAQRGSSSTASQSAQVSASSNRLRALLGLERT